jgi:predicted P-loop ATPase
MLVLVGEQGKYKSSFFRFLALNDDWLNDNFSSLDGDKAFEKLRGMWIVEMAELQATKRAKDVESIKSFITSRNDSYRPPYARRTELHPRMCVLAGTSNPVDFLVDKTGNRRFLPVSCGTNSVNNPFDDEQATRAEVVQAWGEIMDEFLRAGGKVRLVLPKEMERQALKMQSAYQEDDPAVGMIQEWLNTTTEERVCAVQIWREALGHDYDKYEHKNINAIHEIMRNSITGWREVGKQRCGKYGFQRSYERIEKILEVPFD